MVIIPSTMPSRFVILHHKVNGGEHWDLMLEGGEILLTWQLLREPVNSDSLPIPARRIRDHRRAYLDYEGPLGGGRGSIRRVDAGTVEFQKIDATPYIFQLRGGRLSGRFSLAARGDDLVLERL